MSGIVGIFRRDGAPVPAGMLETMIDPIKHRGPDGIRVQYGCGQDANVALGALKLTTTPEMVDEMQPLADETEMVWLVWHGRVDNRDELTNKLTVRGTRLRDCSDAELVLRSYQMWGPKLVDHLIGDFAYAIWDGRTKELHCGRDYLGIKPFYYYIDQHWFIWSSEIRPILEHAFISRQPDNSVIVEYLRSQIRSKQGTFFLNIKRIVPATTIQITADAYKENNYWGREQLELLHYERQSDYIDHFKEVFELSVKCRLRSSHPVGVLLSGGIDSSCVAAEAVRLNQCVEQKNRLEAYTEIFDDRDADEREFGKSVAEHLQLPAHYIPYRTPDSSFFLHQLKQTWLPPPSYNATHMYPLHHTMREHGVRVVLSGHGGDQWLTGSPLYYADLVRTGNFRELLESLRMLSDISSYGHTFKMGMRYAIKPFFHRQTGWLRKQLPSRNTLPIWVRAEFADEAQKPLEHSSRIAPGKFESFAQGSHFLSGTSAFELALQETFDAEYTLSELELRQPLNDRRLVEFALGLPDSLRYQQDQTRFIMREAMRDLIPAEIYARKSKGESSITMIESVNALLPDSEKHRTANWLDYKILESESSHVLNLAHKEPDNEENLQRLRPIWNALGVNIWQHELDNATRKIELNHEAVEERVG